MGIKKYKIRVLEIIIISIIAILTIIFQPPIPLLAIPFLIIITMRTICSKLEDGTCSSGTEKNK